MRKSLTTLVLVLAVHLSATAPARSEDHPWCTEFDPFTKNCSFASYQECVAVAKSVGATCIRNSSYRPPPASAPRQVTRKQH